MYLACLMADETMITEVELNEWIEKAYWSCLNKNAVPWVAAETIFGFKLGMKWIQSEKESIQAAGWVVLACFTCLKKDENLETIPIFFC